MMAGLLTKNTPMIQRVLPRMTVQCNFSLRKVTAMIFTKTVAEAKYVAKPSENWIKAVRANI